MGDCRNFWLGTPHNEATHRRCPRFDDLFYENGEPHTANQVGDEVE